MGKHLQWSRPSKVTSQCQKFLKVPPINCFSIFRETNLTAQKMNFSITEETLNGKPHFLCSALWQGKSKRSHYNQDE